MATTIQSNTRTTESLAYIASGSDGLAVQEASQTLLAYKVREALKAKVISAASLLENVQSTSDLINRTTRYSLINDVAVTPQKIKDADGNEDALSELFLSDGPKLGINLAESQSLLDKLNFIGFTIDAPIFFPILVTVFDKDGQEIDSMVFRLSGSERNIINNYDLVSNHENKIEIREQAIFIEDKDAPDLTIRYTCYDTFANLRPNQYELDIAIAYLISEINNLFSEFTALLIATSKAQDQLQKFIDLSTEGNKNQVTRSREMESQRQQQLIEMINKLRQLKLEKNFNFEKSYDRNIDFPSIYKDILAIKLSEKFPSYNDLFSEFHVQKEEISKQNTFEKDILYNDLLPNNEEKF